LSVQLKIFEVVDQKDWDDFKKSFLADDIPGGKVNREGLPEGEINPISPQYRSNEFQDGPKVGNFILNPFSSFATVFSGKERQKKKLRKAMMEDDGQRVYWNTVNADTLRLFIEVPDSLLPDFIVYCNTTIEDKYLESAYYYQELIRSMYPKFVEERKSKQ